MAKSSSHYKISTIQGCRALAILMIFFLHAFYAASLNKWILLLPSKGLTYYILLSGNSGVDIFFMISGYLAANSMIHGDNFPTFIMKRIIRIYPVFIILLVFTFSVGPLFPHNFLSNISVRDFILSFTFNLLLLPGILEHEAAIPVTWALSYIFYFYILWGLTFNIFKTINESVYYKSLFILVAAGFVLFIYFHPRAIFFLAGIFVYYTRPKIKTYLGGINLFPLLGIISFLSMATLLTFSQTNSYLIYTASLFGYLFLLSILEGKGILTVFLASRIMVFIGDISYSFFLIHGFCQYLIIRFINQISYLQPFNTVSLALFVILSLLLAIILSWISYKTVEDYFTNRFLRKSLIR